MKIIVTITGNLASLNREVFSLNRELTRTDPKGRSSPPKLRSYRRPPPSIAACTIPVTHKQQKSPPRHHHLAPRQVQRCDANMAIPSSRCSRDGMTCPWRAPRAQKPLKNAARDLPGPPSPVRVHSTCTISPASVKFFRLKMMNGASWAAEGPCWQAPHRGG